MPNPWYVTGWTSQQPYPGYDDVVVVGPNHLPEDIPRIEITANYVRVSGWTVTGSVKFTVVKPVLDEDDATLILPDSIIGRVKKGAMSVTLPAGFVYKVKEFVPGGRRFTISIPGNQTGPVDINSLPKVEI